MLEIFVKEESRYEQGYEKVRRNVCGIGVGNYYFYSKLRLRIFNASADTAGRSKKAA